MKVPAGQVNSRGSLPHSENNVLQPMLHPVQVSLAALMAVWSRALPQTASKKVASDLGLGDGF